MCRDFAELKGIFRELNPSLVERGFPVLDPRVIRKRGHGSHRIHNIWTSHLGQPNQGSEYFSEWPFHF